MGVVKPPGALMGHMLLTRGKRVVAEATIKDELLRSIMGVSAAELFRNRQISMAGSFLVGSANNGAHAANGLTALFIATGRARTWRTYPSRTPQLSTHS